MRQLTEQEQEKRFLQAQRIEIAYKALGIGIKQMLDDKTDDGYHFLLHSRKVLDAFIREDGLVWKDHHLYPAEEVKVVEQKKTGLF